MVARWWGFLDRIVSTAGPERKTMDSSGWRMCGCRLLWLLSDADLQGRSGANEPLLVGNKECAHVRLGALTYACARAPKHTHTYVYERARVRTYTHTRRFI